MPGKEINSPRKIPRQKRSEGTFNAILQATTHILEEEGHDNTSTNKIALRAGVSIGSLYQYFPKKEAIITALIRLHTRKKLELMQGQLVQLEGSTLTVKIRTLIESYIDSVLLNPRLEKIIQLEIPRMGQEEEINRMEAHLYQLFEDHLLTESPPLRPKNLKLAAFILVQSIKAVALKALTPDNASLVVPFSRKIQKQEKRVTELVDELVNMALGYLT